MRIQSELANWVVLIAVSIPAQAAISTISSSAGSIEAGKSVYLEHCSACHGEKGDGAGPASVWLFPRPRDFSAGMFKIKSTPGTALPTDEDLFNTVTRGMAGSSMPSFTYLSAQERREAVQYIKYLTAFTDTSGKRVNRFVQAAADRQLAEPIVVPPEPPVTV